jgi:tetratricopeptide (TPR) repeat protein
MAKKAFISFFLIQTLLNIGLISGQQAYNDGWKSFSKNDRTEARKFFNQAISNPATSADALLSLSLLDWTENKSDAAFDDFQKFYNISPNPYPYLYAMSTLPYVFDQDNVLPAAKVAFLDKILNDPKLNGTLKAMISERLGSHFLKTNNPKKSAEYYSKMGALTHWQVLGSFDNTSGSGFAKDWGAVSKPSTTDIFKNKVDADVQWYSPKYNRENNWFAFDYYFYLNNAIMYAQTFVTSPTDQEVYLRAGTSGSLKIWVNDALISSVPEERNCDLDIYAYKVKLNSGNNRILVQIGLSEIDRANFLVRLTDENANPIPNLTSSDTYADYTKSTENSSCEQLPFFAEKFFTDKVAESKNNPLNYILLSEVYLRNDKSYEATKTLKTVEELSGKSTLTSYRLYEAFIRAQNQTDYEKEMEAIKTNDPDCFFSLQYKYSEAIKSEKYDEAADICKKVKTLYGESSTTDEWDINLSSYQKRYDDLIAMAKRLYKKYPNRADYMQLNNQIEKNVSKNPKAAIAVIEDFCRNNTNNDVLNLLAKSYLELGNSDKGLNVLYKRLENNPYATGYYDNLISTLFGMQRYNEALAFCEKGLSLAPFIPNFYSTRGYIYKNMNMTDKAIESFKKAIYYSPTSYDSRTQLRLLENKKEVYDLFPKTNLNDLISKAPGAKEYPEDNSLVLLNNYQMVVYPEGAKEYQYELAAKILNQSGIETWKEYSVGYNGYNQKLIIDKAEVIKANGSVVKAETNDDNHVVFTNLEVNDVLHLEYRIQDLSTGKLAKQFFDHFQFQYTIPTLISRYSLLVPEDKKFEYMISNGTIEPEITTVENMKLYKWELDNQPAVKDEPHMSDLTDVVPTLYYSSFPNWKFVSDWYKDLTTSKFKSDYVLKETLAKLLAGKENAGKLEKAKIFYNYILENITYSSVDFLQSNYIPQKASRTITTRLGDCKDLSTLFVALCREAGIDANLVLILTRDNGSKSLVMPAIEFNHCIAQLNIDNKNYYLELTDNTLPFGSALKSDLNAQILPIPFAAEPFGDKLLSMNMPNRQPNISIRTHKISFSKNDMTIYRDQVYYGAMASYQRGDFKNVGADEQLKKINESVAKEFDVATKVSNLNLTQLDNLADSVTVAYKVEVKNAMQDVAGMKIFRLPWTDTNSLDIVASETRKYPMEYWSYQTEDKTTEKMTIEIPQGKKLAEIPQNQKFDCTAASYQLIFDVSVPGKLKVTRNFERKSDYISIQDYAAFREFLNNVSEWDSKQYAFK